MDRNNSLFLTEVVVILIIVNIMIPIAGWMADLFQFKGIIRVVFGITVLAAAIWLFNWILNFQNRKDNRKYKAQDK